MKISIPKETHPKESRIPVIPPDVEKLVKLGAEVEMESGVGDSIRVADDDFIKAGAKMVKDRQAMLANVLQPLKM